MKTVTCLDTGETFEDVYEYLESNHWQNKKEIFLTYISKHPNKCYMCRRNRKNVNIRHANHKRLGNEKDTDLIVLCENCLDRINRVCDSRYHPNLSKEINKIKKRQKAIKQKKKLDREWLAENYK